MEKTKKSLKKVSEKSKKMQKKGIFRVFQGFICAFFAGDQHF